MVTMAVASELSVPNATLYSIIDWLAASAGVAWPLPCGECEEQSLNSVPITCAIADIKKHT